MCSWITVRQQIDISGIAYLTERVCIKLTALINQNMNGVLLTDVISPTVAAASAADQVFKLMGWTDPNMIQIVRQTLHTAHRARSAPVRGFPRVSGLFDFGDNEVFSCQILTHPCSPLFTHGTQK